MTAHSVAKGRSIQTAQEVNCLFKRVSKAVINEKYPVVCSVIKMNNLKLIIWLVLLMQQETLLVLCASKVYNARAAPEVAKPEVTDKNLMTVLGKSRQLRCVRCYEDRYNDRGRYPAAGYGRIADDRGAGSNWYYQYDRTEDRYRDYDRYDRYNPRGYDRYEARDYDRGYDYRPNDRYDDRRLGYDRTDPRGYDRFGYGSVDRERYLERPPSRPLEYGADRDYYDRYSYRDYRPWDESYRGESGFDSKGHGHYFGSQEDRRYLPEEDRRYLPEEDRRYLPEDDRRQMSNEDRRYLPEDDRRYLPNGDHRYLPEDDRRSSGCRYGNCRFGMSDGSRGDSTSKVSSGTIESNSASPNAMGTTVMNKDADKTNQNSNNNNMRGNENKQNDRQQSAAYGARPPRPLGGSYFDRDGSSFGRDNEIGKSKK